jgi:hypothetical protein
MCSSHLKLGRDNSYHSFINNILEEQVPPTGEGKDTHFNKRGRNCILKKRTIYLFEAYFTTLSVAQRMMIG